jgi:hypothetical protein
VHTSLHFEARVNEYLLVLQPLIKNGRFYRFVQLAFHTVRRSPQTCTAQFWTSLIEP